MAAHVLSLTRVLGAIAWAVVAPDREACKSAIAREIDAMLASNQPIDRSKDDPKLQARLKARATWPCRFQSDSDMESIAGEINMARLPQILVRSINETFGKTEPTPEPTESPTPEWRTSKDDWKASLKIVSKKCYGYGFGCSIDAKVSSAITATAAPSRRTPRSRLHTRSRVPRMAQLSVPQK